jgi:hypothetical protein
MIDCKKLRKLIKNECWPRMHPFVSEYILLSADSGNYVVQQLAAQLARMATQTKQSPPNSSTQDLFWAPLVTQVCVAPHFEVYQAPLDQPSCSGQSQSCSFCKSTTVMRSPARSNHVRCTWTLADLVLKSNESATINNILSVCSQHKERHV